MYGTLATIAPGRQPRTGQVVVGGHTSDDVRLANQLFLGTVWCPPLRNDFFADASARA